MQKLIYVYDPMCSWCFGFAPTLKSIRQGLPASVQFDFLLGGLAPDSDVPMASAMADKLAQTWHRIESMCGVSFDHSYWQQTPLPPRSTYIAGRAVLAGVAQGQTTDTMLAAIQTAYYAQAKNVWDAAVLIEIAHSLGLDSQQFADDLEGIRPQHEQQLQRSMSMGVQGFPSLVWQDDQQMGLLPIDFGHPEATLNIIGQLTSK